VVNWDLQQRGMWDAIKCAVREVYADVGAAGLPVRVVEIKLASDPTIYRLPQPFTGWDAGISFTVAAPKGGEE
jgi:hypothetical protein